MTEEVRDGVPRGPKVRGDDVFWLYRLKQVDVHTTITRNKSPEIVHIQDVFKQTVGVTVSVHESTSTFIL